MKIFNYETTQYLPISLEEAWAFFSSPANLELLTPADMQFKVLSKLDTQIADNMIIDYVVSPLFRIPLRWRTEILDVEWKVKFIDIQKIGPFKKWRHEHTFSEIENGVCMHDKVEYILPFGYIGELAHSLFIKRRIDQIFKYRKEVLEKLFPQV